MRQTTLAVLLTLVFSASIPAASPPSATEVVAERALDDLLQLMKQRLDVMHDVARTKWATQAPIEDPTREKALLDDVAARGRAVGLDPTVTRSFFAAQLEAAKHAQRADFRRWKAGHAVPNGEAPDLVRVLRPRIDALNRDLLAALARLQALPRDRQPTPASVRTRADALITGTPIDPAAREAAIKPLLKR